MKRAQWVLTWKVSLASSSVVAIFAVAANLGLLGENQAVAVFGKWGITSVFAIIGLLIVGIEKGLLFVAGEGPRALLTVPSGGPYDIGEWDPEGCVYELLDEHGQLVERGNATPVMTFGGNWFFDLPATAWSSSYVRLDLRDEQGNRWFSPPSSLKSLEVRLEPYRPVESVAKTAESNPKFSDLVTDLSSTISQKSASLHIADAIVDLSKESAESLGPDIVDEILAKREGDILARASSSIQELKRESRKAAGEDKGAHPGVLSKIVDGIGKLPTPLRFLGYIIIALIVSAVTLSSAQNVLNTVILLTIIGTILSVALEVGLFRKRRAPPRGEIFDDVYTELKTNFRENPEKLSMCDFRSDYVWRGLRLVGIRVAIQGRGHCYRVYVGLKRAPFSIDSIVRAAGPCPESFA